MDGRVETLERGHGHVEESRFSDTLWHSLHDQDRHLQKLSEKAIPLVSVPSLPVLCFYESQTGYRNMPVWFLACS
jgi:hypothetical protein